MLRTWGGHGGFYQPGYRDGAKLCLQMMCLGKNWDPQTKSDEEFQSINGAKPPTVPDILKKLVGEALHASTAIIREGRVRNPVDALPWMEPDICFVNFYAQSGKLGLHQIAELIKDELWPNPLRYFNNDADEDFDGDEDDDENYRK